MQNSVIPDDQIEDANAGESAHTAANASSSQADASASMTSDDEATPGGPAPGAGESPAVDDAAVPSPS